MTAYPLIHKVVSFGYMIVEAEKRGKLDAAKATQLGASKKDLGMLSSGKDVTLANGQVIKVLRDKESFDLLEFRSGWRDTSREEICIFGGYFELRFTCSVCRRSSCPRSRSTGNIVLSYWNVGNIRR